MGSESHVFHTNSGLLGTEALKPAPPLHGRGVEISAVSQKKCELSML
jgi:hypothetical protein